MVASPPRTPDDRRHRRDAEGPATPTSSEAWRSWGWSNVVRESGRHPRMCQQGVPAPDLGLIDAFLRRAADKPPAVRREGRIDDASDEELRRLHLEQKKRLTEIGNLYGSAPQSPPAPGERGYRGRGPPPARTAGIRPPDNRKPRKAEGTLRPRRGDRGARTSGHPGPPGRRTDRAGYRHHPGHSRGTLPGPRSEPRRSRFADRPK